MVRVPTAALPANWSVCSGEPDQPLADGGPGVKYRVTSDKASTIDVTIYDSADQSDTKTIPPGLPADLPVTVTLFLSPDSSHSGTAQGQYWCLPPSS